MRPKNVQEWFGEAAGKYEERVAVESPRGEMSYGEVNGKANRLGNRLREGGGRAGTVVGIWVEEPEAVIWAILGCLKAGCAFLPLSVETPVGRLKVLLKEVEPEWMVAEKGSLGKLRESGWSGETVVVDGEEGEEWEGVKGKSLGSNEEECGVELEGEGMAYLYCTSGSTGQPKAIAGRVKAIDHYIRWEVERLGLGEGVRVSQLTKPPFDAFLRDMFVPLCTGGRVCIPGAETVLDGGELRKWVRERGVEVVHCVPSLLRTMLGSGEGKGEGGALRYILVAGEPLLPSDVGRCGEEFGSGVQLVNLYGPTETTMTKLFYFVRPGDEKRRTIPLGKPMRGARAVLVNDGGKICSPGMTGEIYIRTPYRTLGYYRRPELTEEVFVVNPFTGEDGDVVNKTGDLGRINEEGDYEYLGRRDQQVKIRGNRVELAEIESVVRSSGKVKDVAVVDQKGEEEGSRRLCAYVVPEEGMGVGWVRGYCAEVLPDYMVPAGVVKMESLPRTLNGKIDRRQLPVGAGEGEGGEYEGPRTAVEEILAGLWGAVLKRERVGIREDFFQLGGHSLLAMQLMSRMRTVFPVEVPLRWLFEARTVEAMGERIEAAGRKREGVEEARLEKRKAEEAVPLSFAQRRLWFLDQLEPGQTVYQIGSGVRMKGSMRVGRLEESLQRVMERHESLRSTFHNEGGEGVVRVNAGMRMRFSQVDVSGMGEREREQAMRAAGREESGEAFELERGPLVRFVLVRMSGEEHVGLFTMHHIISDAWSMGVLVREVAEEYGKEGSQAGRGEGLQYGDYAVWQREWLKGEELERQLGYWREKLAGAKTVLEMGVGRSRSGAGGYAGAVEGLELEPELYRQAQQMSRREGVTLFMLLLAAYEVLLWRYSGQKDILIGTPIANRTRTELEGMIGFFANTLVMRAELEGKERFEELLGKVRETALGAYGHQDVPFERLVEALQPERRVDVQPLFQVAFTMQNVPSGELKLEGLEMRREEGEQTTSKFDLNLIVVEAGERGIRVLMEYSTEVYERETIRGMLGHWRELLKEGVEEPGRRIGELRMLREQEREQVLREWNRTESEYGAGRDMAGLFEEQVGRNGEATAVVWGSERISYGELNRRANQLGHYLRRLGVGPETRVGVALPRSPELIVALLAILKAGGAYVPLDLSYPKSRLQYMFDDAGMAMVLTERPRCDSLGIRDARPVCVDEVREATEQEPQENPVSGVNPANVAYVIYTSGSTGLPKGVAIEHASATAFIAWARDVFGAQLRHGVLASTSICFDLSVFEIFGTLCSGGVVLLVENALAIAGAANLESALLINTVPSAIAELVELRALPPGVAVVNLAGEALMGALVRRIHEGYPDVEVFNLYGPTEYTTYTTFTKVVPGPGAMAIGRPIANTRVYVLDGEMEPVPVGVKGELYIGGAGLARGYWGKAELTAERFVPDPYGEQGERLYRTGDVARYRADGAIEYVGRRDEQVKIRGYRIELGEIEEALRSHAGVREAAVVVREEGGHKRLVAYVSGEGLPKGSGWREYLGERLPEYMLPSVYVELERMPLTANGKLDRRALPEPGGERPEQERGYVEPRNGREEILAGIWSRVLGVKQVGVHDNFFGLGGDSILSIQVVARAREAGLRLTPRQMFERQTVAELAEVAGSGPGVEAEQGRVEGEVELTPVQRWYLEGEPEEAWHFNQGVMLEARGGMKAWELERAVGAVVEQHDALRMRFERREEGGWRQYQGKAEGRMVGEVDLKRLRGEQGKRAQGEVMEQVQGSLDLEKGPVLRAVLVKRGEGERVGMGIHHLVVDGVSWRILLEDLEKGLRGERLGAKTSSYRQWAGRLSEFGASEEVERDRSYWEGQRSRAVAELEGEGENRHGDVRQVNGELSRERSLELLQIGQRYRTEVESVLLAGLGRALGRWSGAEAVRVEVEGHGRQELFEEVDLTRTVGWFTVIYPVVLEGKGRAREVLGRARQRRGEVKWGGLGYGLLQGRGLEELGSQVLFNYLGQIDGSWEEGGRLGGSGEWAGRMRSGAGRRKHELEVHAVVAGGRLRMALGYREGWRSRARMEELLELWKAEVEELTEYCRQAPESGYIGLDFPLARLGEQELERLCGHSREIEDIYPLSPMQEGMLFHSLSSPDPSLYSIQACWRFAGLVDVPKFQKAWELVIARHTILRSCFYWERDGEPLQIVTRAVEPEWCVESWPHLTAADQSRRLAEHRRMDCSRGFDLRLPPLMRFTLIELGDEEYAFLWTHHHLVLDGWSAPIVLHEVLSYYEAQLQGRAVRLDEPVPFGNYISWVRRQNWSDAEVYWREWAKGDVEPTHLSLPEPRRVDSLSSGVEETEADESKMAQLARFVRENRLTLDTVFLAAWAVLLNRFTGRKEVLFGSVVSGRPPELPRAEMIVGVFINALPVRIEVPPSMAVIDWLRKLQEARAIQRQFSYTPLKNIQIWSGIAAGSSLFESVLIHENFPVTGIEEKSSLHARDLEIRGRSNHPLTLHVRSRRCLNVGASYDPAVFRREDIVQVLELYLRLLAEIVSQPNRAVGEVALLSEEKRREVLEGWRGAEREYGRAGVVRRMEEMGKREPERVAVVMGERRVSYGEMVRRGGEIGRKLREWGVGKEGRVGVGMGRKVEMMMAVVGIWKAGGAYVPLEPGSPEERLKYVLEDAGVEIVVADRETAGEYRRLGVEVLEVGEEEEAGARGEEEGVEVEEENLAYVMYTSGSTGKPKGVGVTHGGLWNYLMWIGEGYGEGEWRTLVHTAVSFDLTVTGMWGPLVRGGQVELLGEGVGVEGLREALKRGQGWTHVKMTPGQMDSLGVEGLGQWAGGSGVLILGGEALQGESLRWWQEQFPESRIYNEYGPTETVVGSSVQEVVGAQEGAVAIGRPIANTRVYVLDGELEPVPVGVKGELYIGGAGLARGYWGKAELTAERFVPDPYGEQGERLYRTGDVARCRADGAIEYVGRRDEQVKIRGYRIELGEVEEALRSHAGVREAAVVVREEGDHKRLVAYVSGEGLPKGSGWREYLGERLPEYMLPSVYVKLERMPLTANGKLDRRALPEPGGERPEQERGYVEPRNKREEILAGIWSRVLGVKQVGVHDNFFGLGGDSILCIQVVVRAGEAGLRISLQQMFEHQTVAELAEVAGSGAGVEAEQGRVEGEVELTPVQRWYLEGEPEEAWHFNQGVMLEARGGMKVWELERAVGAVVEQHDALRMRFERREEGGWRQYQGKAEGRMVGEVDLRGLRGERGKRAQGEVMEQVQGSLDLEKGPVLRAVLVKRGEGERVGMGIHHLVVDGVSWRILLEDLEKGLRGERLGAKTSSYRQWAGRLSEFGASEEVERDRSYWEGQRSRAVAELEGEGENRHEDVRQVNGELSRERSLELLQIGQRYRTEAESVLLAGLGRALGRWSGAEAVRVEVEGHGRQELFEEVDLTRTVGWFTVIYPVVLEGKGSAREVLGRARQRRGEVKWGGLGYGLLQGRGLEELRSQVLFNYLGQIDGSWEEGGRLGGSGEWAGRMRSGAGRRKHELEVHAVVAGGRLRMALGYREGWRSRERMEELLELWKAEVEELTEYSRQAPESGYIGLDFPLARLGEQELERLCGHSREIEDIYPLSPMQEGMLFHGLSAPGSGEYVVQMCCELEGELEVEALEESWAYVMKRHGVLRTSIHWEGLERPVQVVRRDARLKVREQDWRAERGERQRELLKEYMEQDREKGFGFEEAPLMRMGLMRVGERSWWMVWSHHHVLMDGWSTPIVLAEVGRAYRERRRGQWGEWERAGEYRGYIGWLQKQSEGEAEEYWRKRLGGWSGGAGIEGRREEREQERGEEVQRLSGEESGELQQWAQRHQLTLSTVMQGGWAAVVSRHSGEEEVVYGVTVAGRPAELAGVEKTVGLFINTLPVRVRVGGEAGVVEWLKQLQQQQQESRQYEYSALWQVRGWSGVERSKGLFDHIFVFENYPLPEWKREEDREAGEPELGLENLGVREQTSYPLTVLVHPGAEIEMRVVYQGGRYGAGQMRRILGHWRNVLMGMMRAEGQRVGEIALMSGEEREEIVRGWNGTREERREGTVLDWIEAKAEERSGKVAVRDEQEELSYGELEERANRLGRYLRKRGVREESRVGIWMERGVGLMVGLLGIWKAGGAYVPLDRSYPRERVEYMVKDAGVEVVVSDGGMEWLKGIGGEVEVEVVNVEEREEEIGRESGERMERRVEGENAAYVIYTSGSTGKPKGAVNTQSGIANRLEWMQRAYGMGEGDRVLQKTTMSFDVSVWEFFWPLMSGAELVMARPGGQQDSRYLVEVMEREGITTVHFVPSMLGAWLEEEGVRRLRKLKRVVCSGEALSRELQEKFYARVEGAELDNLYGPTEAAVDVSYWKCEAGQEVAIGRPIANTQLYVLDGEMEPVPVGVKGELYIGGAGLARGYWGKAELTAERFVPDPYGEQGERLYRTGDVARYRADGAIEYVGRRDEQVKIRGYRIELGEIEEALRSHAGVREAAVVVREEGSHKRLVAYVSGEGLPKGSGWREYLGERLPEYMLPSVYVELERMPLTANGKLDRRALPEPGGERPEQERGYVEPRNGREEILAGIWSRVLGVKQVGVHDNFFGLGGDSILSIQVVARAREAGLRLTPRQMFERQTVAELAEVAGSGPGVEAEQGRVEGEVELTPVQRWYLEGEPEEAWHFNQGVMLEARGGMKVWELERAVGAVVEQHDALRMRFERREEGGWRQYQGKAEGRMVGEVDLKRLRGEQGRRAQGEVMEQVQGSLDLEKGPVLRAVLVKRGEGERVGMGIHHLAVDGVSWRILLEDLEKGLRGERLGAKTSSYRQWASELSREARRPWLEQEQEFWRESGKEVRSIPVQGSGENRVSSGEAVWVSLSREETEDLLRRVPEVYGTQIQEVLLAGLGEALGQWAGGAVVVEVEGHGRQELFEELDLTRTVGWFTAIYPVRLQRSQGEVGEHLTRVKEQLRNIPRQGIGYGMLRYLKQGWEGIAAQVAFNYLGQLDTVLRPDGRLAPVAESSGGGRSPQARRNYLLEINAAISGGQLRFQWSYSNQLHERATIESVAHQFLSALRNIVSHCLSRTAVAYTPSDFPEAGLDSQSLQRVLDGSKSIEDVYSLSPLQHGILFHSVYSPEAGDYLDQLIVDLDADFEFELFCAAWKQIVLRHATLRTSFAWERLNRPVQVVHRDVELPIEEVDLARDGDATQALEGFLCRDRNRYFDLSRAPLVRITVAQVAEQARCIVLTFHHLLLDGWSVALVLQDLMRSYLALRQGADPSLPAIRPYRDYIAWLKRRSGDTDRDFWTAYLQGCRQAATFESEDAGESSENRTETIMLPADVTLQLSALARRHQLTMNTVAVGAWGLLLGRYFDEEDVVFGTVTSGRPATLPGVESMVGLFINTIPVRVRVRETDRVIPWLLELQAQQASLREHEHSALIDIQEWCGIPRDVPVFESILVFENYPVDVAMRREGGSAGVRGVRSIEKTNYRLHLEVHPGSSLRFDLHYDTGRFDRKYIESMLRYLTAILVHIARDPNCVLFDVALDQSGLSPARIVTAAS